MESTLGRLARSNATGFNAGRSISSGRLLLRMGLGGLALLLWQAPWAKAQECCPDQYTEAEMARAASSAKKPVNVAVVKEQGHTAAGTKIGSGARTGAKAAGNKKAKAHARQVALQQGAKGSKANEPAASVPVRQTEVPGDGKVQKKADGQADKNPAGAGL